MKVREKEDSRDVVFNPGPEDMTHSVQSLMIWWSQSGVLNMENIQNVQCCGSQESELKPLHRA